MYRRYHPREKRYQVCFLVPAPPPLARRREEAAVGARREADGDEHGRCVRAPPPCVGERGEQAARCVRAPGELEGSARGTGAPAPSPLWSAPPRRRASRAVTAAAVAAAAEAAAVAAAASAAAEVLAARRVAGDTPRACSS